MTVVDAHTHIFPAAVIARRGEFLRRDPVFASLYSAPRARLASADDLVAAMDRSGVTQSIACGFGWSTPELCRAGNDAVIDAVQRHPDRIVGFGTVAPAVSLVEALREIDRLAEAGIRGLGELQPDAQALFEMPPEELAALAAAIRKHQLALLLHASEPVGHHYAGKGRSTPERLERLLPAFSDVPVILAHAGGGLAFYAFMPEVRQTLSRAYVDTAALPLLYRPEALKALVLALGADRVLFGSDYPLQSPDRALAYLEKAGLSDDERAAILSGNAIRLLGRLSGPEP